MGQTPDEVRADIEGTRIDMTATLDALGNKMSPKHAVHNQVGRARGRLIAIKETIMGSVDNAGARIQSKGGAAREQTQHLARGLQDVPQRARSETQGNPLAAGLIAFGAGLLAASLMPPSDAERQVASRAADIVQPAVARGQHVAQDIKGQMQDAVQGAAEQIKETASDAAATMKEEVTSSGHEVANSSRNTAA